MPPKQRPRKLRAPPWAANFCGFCGCLSGQPISTCPRCGRSKAALVWEESASERPRGALGWFEFVSFLIPSLFAFFVCVVCVGYFLVEAVRKESWKVFEAAAVAFMIVFFAAGAIAIGALVMELIQRLGHRVWRFHGVDGFVQGRVESQWGRLCGGYGGWIVGTAPLTTSGEAPRADEVDSADCSQVARELRTLLPPGSLHERAELVGARVLILAAVLHMASQGHLHVIRVERRSWRRDKGDSEAPSTWHALAVRASEAPPRANTLEWLLWSELRRHAEPSAAPTRSDGDPYRAHPRRALTDLGATIDQVTRLCEELIHELDADVPPDPLAHPPAAIAARLAAALAANQELATALVSFASVVPRDGLSAR